MKLKQRKDYLKEYGAKTTIVSEIFKIIFGMLGYSFDQMQRLRVYVGVFFTKIINITSNYISYAPTYIGQDKQN